MWCWQCSWVSHIKTAAFMSQSEISLPCWCISTFEWQLCQHSAIIKQTQVSRAYSIEASGKTSNLPLKILKSNLQVALTKISLLKLLDCCQDLKMVDVRGWNISSKDHKAINDKISSLQHRNLSVFTWRIYIFHLCTTMILRWSMHCYPILWCRWIQTV